MKMSIGKLSGIGKQICQDILKFCKRKYQAKGKQHLYDDLENII